MNIITDKEIQCAREKGVRVEFDEKCQVKPDDKTILVQSRRQRVYDDFFGYGGDNVYVTYSCFIGSRFIGYKTARIQTVPGFLGVKPRPTWFGQFRRRRAFKRALDVLS